jgi:hypothetical protein
MKRLVQISRQRFSAILAGEDSLDRVCRDIPEEACRETRRNYVLNVANGASTKLAEQVAGPNLIMVWLLQIIGAPVWMLGCLMPIKQAASLLPQLVASGQIRRLAVRKWVWVAAGLIQTVCLLLMIPFAALLTPVVAGAAILLLFVLFSAASGTASVAFQDVLGKTISKGHRGRLLASRALLGGLLTIVAGVIVRQLKAGGDDLTTVFWMLATGALLWALGALLFGQTREQAGATQGGRNPIEEAGAGLTLFREHKGFRRFLYARSLLLTVEIATPFYVLHANHLLKLDSRLIGYIVIAIGLSQVLSSPFWGRLADRTSRTVMQISAWMAVVASILAVLLTWLPLPVVQQGGYFLVFMLLGLTEAGVRLGRKTYLVDAVPQAERATYTAISNTLVGIVAVGTGLAGLIAQYGGPLIMIVVLGLGALCSAVACLRLPEADRMLGG